MLKDRKALLEQEIRKAHEAAASMYLTIVVDDSGNVHSNEYQNLKERITNLQFDLDMVNKLIYKGHE